MDYYSLRNLQADTDMRNSLSGDGDTELPNAEGETS
jgi:uncharacterized protein YqfA (UPF0365 family)